MSSTNKVSMPYGEAPPPYDVQASAPVSSLSSTNTKVESSRGKIDNIANFKPIVIPQTTAKVMNAFISPFARAYPVELAPVMSDEAFLNFIDDLNEAFMSSPVFQILGLAGVAMQFDPIGAVNFIGMGVQVGTGVASGATSYARTYHYVKKMNKSVFRPLGLQVRIFSTKKMTHEIGIPEDKQIELPPLPEYVDEWDPAAPELDPRQRRLAALSDHVAELDWQVAPKKMPDNFLKKIGAWQANRQESKQRKRQAKRLRKIQSREAKAAALRDGDPSARYDAKRAKAADRLERRGNTARSQEKYQKKMAKLDRKEAKANASNKEGKPQKAAKADEKATKKREKHEKRERKYLQKVRWIVITQSDVNAPEDQDGKEEDLDLGIERVGESSSSSSSSSDSDSDSDSESESE